MNIGKLTALESLDLTSNKIKFVPPEIAKLSNLYLFKLRNNPVLSPPPEIYHRGTAAILEYMKNHLAGNYLFISRKFYENSQIYFSEEFSLFFSDFFKFLLIL